VAREFASEGIRIVARSEPFPGPPLVVRAGNPDPAIAELRRLLLALDTGRRADPALTTGLAREFAHGFVAVDAGTYAAMVRVLAARAAR
jgi:ABC-type phosphate/phosphonate transport system substrate-binding protein